MKSLSLSIVLALAACAGGTSSAPIITGASSLGTSTVVAASSPTPAPLVVVPSPTPSPAPGTLTITVPTCKPGVLLVIPNSVLGITLDPTCNLGQDDAMTATSDNPAVAVKQEPQVYNVYVFVVTGAGEANITITDLVNGATVTVRVGAA